MDRMTAFHEAAHAVALLHAGVDPYIDLRGRRGAQACTGYRGRHRKFEDAINLRICLAGVAANRKRPGVDLRYDIDGRKSRHAPAAGDMRKARRILNRNGWDEDQKLAEVQAWVQEEWAAITAVGLGVVDIDLPRIVTGHEIRQFMAKGRGAP